MKSIIVWFQLDSYTKKLYNTPFHSRIHTGFYVDCFGKQYDELSQILRRMIMGYELHKKNVQRKDYGMKWNLIPCIAIVKSGITFNDKAVVMFSLEDTPNLLIFKDMKNNKIAFKIPINDHELKNSYRFYKPWGKNNKTKSKMLSTTSVSKLFSKYMGKAFEIKMNSSQLLMEVSLGDS